jgi:hypothetical protein
MDLEEFVDIIGYEGIYKINKNGDIYSIKNKKIRKPKLHKGYYYISLSKNGKEKTCGIHRLIGIHFIPNDDINKKCVDHINGDSTNNNIENLRWVRKIDNDRNHKINDIYERIRKDTGKIYYQAHYSIYINDERKSYTKKNQNRNVVEEWVEEMKKEYPNEYTAGRI